MVFKWRKVQKKKYKNIWWNNGNLEQDMEKLDSIIVPSHAQLLFCPPLTLFLSLSLGKLERGGNVERKEAFKMAGEPCRAARLQRLDCRAENERSHVKLIQVWDLLALQASFLSHLSHWVINITHLRSRLFFWQAIVEAPFFLSWLLVFFLPGGVTQSVTLIHAEMTDCLRTQCRPAYYNIWGWLFLVTTINYERYKSPVLQFYCISTAMMIRQFRPIRHWMRQDHTVTVLLSGICCCATVMIEFKGHSIDFTHPLLLLLSLWNMYHYF